MAKGSSVLAVLLVLFSCAPLSRHPNLTAEENEFLSTVRYIITKQERRAFLDLPAPDRQQFIEEFWKRRDPRPETEANEYKDEYYRRVQDAKHLFTEGGVSGWLQDRGRVYILLGPPEQREQYPRGIHFYGPPVEIWHYGFHELYFVDNDWSGNFELRPQSVRMLSEINAAQVELRPHLAQEKVLSDFNLDIKKLDGGEMVFLISVPYQKIWLSSEAGELKTTLEATVEVFDKADKKVKEESRTAPVSLSQEKLKELLGRDLVIEIPLRLESGEYRAAVNLKNLTDRTQVRKNIKLTV